ncbi:MAG: dihydroorotase [Desulfobulbus propionicus]|nr:MAG: dihydroorotase [Desulfobulbus propionicus]
MINSWHIQGGRVIDPFRGIDEIGDLVIRNGILLEPGASPADDAQSVDASGCWVVPGLIDMHVHLREPGEEYKEDVQSGTKAAAAGGFTAVACMPNTRPVNDNTAVTALLHERAASASARVYPVAAISRGLNGERLAEFGELRRAGVRAVSDDGHPVVNAQLMRRALEYASDFGLTVIAHCEEPALSRGVMNEGAHSTRLGLQGIPTIAEAVMVYREIALAEFTGKPVHIAHVSTAAALELIRSAKSRGVQVSAETAPHYFTLTDEDVGEYDTLAKVHPPLRGAADRDAVRRALVDGTLDAIASDHAPHSVLEKEVEFAVAANGIIGLETSLPLGLALVRDGSLEPLRLMELLSTAPARILQVPGGSLSPGLPADVTVIDPEQTFIYSRDQVVSRSHNSPFLDWRLTGRAILTLVEGRATHSLL